jgi:hypothetical protein
LAVTHVSKIYAVEDCKIAKLTGDSGASATYAAIIDVPGIKTVEIAGNIDTKELRGDNQLLDSNSTLTNITVNITHAKISLDVLPVILGGTTADSGSTPNQVATFDRLGTDTFDYFKLEAKTPTNGADPTGGDIHFILHKLMISSFPDMGHAEEDYRIVGFTATASPLVSTSKWITVKINETAAAIS